MPINSRSDSYEALMWDVLCNVHGYLPRPGARVLDLGAHFGMFSLYCAARGAEVTAVEPSKKALLELQHSKEVANAIGAGHIEIIPCAVWSEGRGMPLYERSDSSAAHTLMDSSTDKFEIVSARSLRAIMNYQTFDCVKVDIEGAEWEVFRVMEQEDFDRIRFLTIEIHNDLLSLEKRREVGQKLIDAFPHHKIIPVQVNGVATEDVATLICWR